MRKAFVKALCEVAKNDKRIFLITGDLGFNILEPFRDMFPKRYLNIGVAEANLMSVAAGLSTTGFVPFAYSIATFASMRAFEQIRNDICLQNLNVKIVGVGAGLAYTKAGPTHHSIEDIALMRTLPNMTIIAPADPQAVYQVTKKVASYKGPVYVRIERNPEIAVIKKLHRFQIGKGYTITYNGGLALVATGGQIATAVGVSNLLQKKRIKSSVYAFPTIQPLDARLLNRIINHHTILATIEEHNMYGGLASAISEQLSQTGAHLTAKLIRFGLKNEYSPISAGYETFMNYHGLSREQIAKKIVNELHE